MRPFPLAIILLFFVSTTLYAQQSNPSLPGFIQPSSPQPLQRDPQAIQVITQALNAAGGIAALSAIQDYTASGTVNYYWGDGEQGSVVVKGRGTGQFRVDATLPEGVRSWAVSNGTGWVKEADGRTSIIFTHNAANLGSLTFPFTYLIWALQDLSTSLMYVGVETMNGTQVHHVRARRFYSENMDPTGLLAHLSQREFFIDAATSYLVSSQDMTHPMDNAKIDYVRRVEFSHYREISGVSVPFSISESVNGQHGETLQLTQITFNTGLQDSDFSQ